jgi:Peptidase S46
VAYNNIKPYGLARDYYQEIVSKIEIFTIAAQLNTLANAYEKNGQKGYDETKPKVKAMLDDFMKEFNPTVDKNLFEGLMEMYVKNQPENYVSPMAKTLVDADITLASKIVYAETTLTNIAKLNALIDGKPEDLLTFVNGSNIIALQKDLASKYQSVVQKELTGLQANITKLQRTYTQAQMDVFKEKTFFPDANSTLRVTFGQVKGYSPSDGVKFDFKTDLDGLMEKYKPGDYEFDVPEKLLSLYKNKDYSVYGVNGKMPVCFIATNHTTGGNSGSPALDAYGNLIGLNFDRVWEGTMSDINYDASICRNIMVDIRYVLFIVDKFAGAQRLIQEMKLVHPKAKK